MSSVSDITLVLWLKLSLFVLDLSCINYFIRILNLFHSYSEIILNNFRCIVTTKLCMSEIDVFPE